MIEVVSVRHYRQIRQRVQDLIVEGLHTYYVARGENHVLVHNEACFMMSSAIGKDPLFAREAQRAGKDTTVQREMAATFDQLSKGNCQPGMETKYYRSGM
ncbi:hypothetical protein DQ384_18770 [Sphaerisporangium album]|uniref:Intein C-terminal splicing domain-containing protein n=1 Tax=Sphaerisporangium album TaxID=509200 RepID=A0A367FJ20_9ACTN|nr:hypothetical protein [Sphaerisporangium album]RCG29635.1 hypothetical protein DQ384_18770 [Sphaerisporangium album]